MNEAFNSYIEAGSAGQRELFGRLHDIILGLYPDSRQVIYYNLPTFKSGRGQVSLGFWKDGVTLYTTSPANIDPFRGARPKIKTNKASINFRLTDDLPVDDVQAVIRRAMGDG